MAFEGMTIESALGIVEPKTVDELEEVAGGGLGMTPHLAYPAAFARLVAQGVVLGKAATAGSKVSGVAYKTLPNGKKVPITTDDGRIRTFTKDSSGAKGKSWRKDVQASVVDTLRDLGVTEPYREEALAFEVVFFRPRPASHYGTGRNAGTLKGSAPKYPTTRPDAVKLVRAIEDALTGVIWRDDSQSVDVLSRKRYTSGAERCEWRLWVLDG